MVRSRYSAEGNISSAGFTFIELMVVMGVLTTLVVMAAPAYRGIRRNVVVNSEVEKLVDALKRAQSLAMTGQGGADQGVYLEANKYTVYQGTAVDCFVHNNLKEFPLDPVVTIDAPVPKDICFKRLTGRTAAGSFSVNAGIKTVTISAEGLISVN